MSDASQYNFFGLAGSAENDKHQKKKADGGKSNSHKFIIIIIFFQSPQGASPNFAPLHWRAPMAAMAMSPQGALGGQRAFSI